MIIDSHRHVVKKDNSFDTAKELFLSDMQQNDIEKAIVIADNVSDSDTADTPTLLKLFADEDNVKIRADKIHTDLEKAGISVLYDDRDESAGTKFKDADLIGIPLRLVVSSRTMSKNSVEWKERDQKDAKGVTFDALIEEVKHYYAS